MRFDELIGKRIRVWSAQGRDTSVLAEGDVVAVAPGPCVILRSHCECGRETRVSHLLSLPIDELVSEWEPIWRTA